MYLYVYVYVYVYVRTSAAAREQSSNRVPTCGDIWACENSIREHLLDQLFTVGLGPGCPRKNLVKFSETVLFTLFRLTARVKRWLQRQIALTYWTDTRWTKAMTSQVLRCTWPPPRLGSVVIQIVCAWVFSESGSRSVLWIPFLRERVSNKLLFM